MSQLFKLLRARVNSNFALLELYKRFQTYLYHVEQLPLEQIPRETLVEKLKYDLFDFSNPTVRMMASAFMPAYGGHVRYFNATHTKGQTLHDDDSCPAC